jgi:hypothetical protein
MYEGYLAIDGVEVVNTHRAAAYAATAGLGWVKGCSSCSSINAATGGSYQSPKLDEDKPPWWDEDNPDAMSFLGVIGLSVSNVDDSTRDVPVQAGASSGGFIGALRFTARSITVRALLVAADDCSLGFGLEWLRGINADETCATGVTLMFDCCPNVAQSDCEDPECVDACILSRMRFFYESRITEGPTVLSRRESTTRGAWAQVEFVITAGDPGIYSDLPPIVAAIPASDPISEELPDESVVEDPFSVSTQYAFRPESLSDRGLPARAEWTRQVVAAPKPPYGRFATPIITLATVGGDAEDVRVTFVSRGQSVGAFRLPFLPVGGTVTVNYRDRTVHTQAHGVARRNNAFARSVSGAPMVWPIELPADEVEVWVDRAPSDPPLAIGFAVQGVGQP